MACWCKADCPAFQWKQLLRASMLANQLRPECGTRGAALRPSTTARAGRVAAASAASRCSASLRRAGAAQPAARSVQRAPPAACRHVPAVLTPPAQSRRGVRPGRQRNGRRHVLDLRSGYHACDAHHHGAPRAGLGGGQRAARPPASSTALTPRPPHLRWWAPPATWRARRLSRPCSRCSTRECCRRRVLAGPTTFRARPF